MLQKKEIETYPCRQVLGCLLLEEWMPSSCWKAPLAAGNGVVVVVLDDDEEMEQNLREMREIQMDMCM